MAGGPFDAVLADLTRLQIRRLREGSPTSRQLRKARGQLESLIGKAPPERLRPLFQTLLELENEAP
ncbi:MAG: hypothetical protein RLZZ09_1819 [Pseudomonadota bacterium]|jgi:hypothetical protein